MENQNNVSNGNIQCNDTTTSSNIVETLSKLVSESRIVFSFFISIIPTINVLKNEVLAIGKGILYGIPNYYFINSNMLENILVAVFIIIASFCIFNTIKVVLSSSIGFKHIAPLAIIFVTGIFLYIELSVFIKLYDNTKDIYIALCKLFSITVYIFIIILISGIVFLLLLKFFENNSPWKRILDIIFKVLRVIFCAIIVSTSIFSIIIFGLNWSIKSVENNKEYELITNVDDNIYEVVITRYEDSLVVMGGYSCGDVLHIEKSKGYRIIERTESQQIKYFVFHEVDFY